MSSVGGSETKTAPPELVKSDSQSQLWRTGKGTLALRWNESGALHIALNGHGDRRLAPVVLRRKNAIVACDKIRLFYDFSLMPTYDSEMRTEWTSWLVHHRARVQEIHIVARSKLVAMGVSVANLALGGMIKSYGTADGPFTKAMREASIEPAERSA
jgi:hypothetical protein